MRGKQSVANAERRSHEQKDNDIANYQAKVRDLSAEVRQLRDALDRTQREAKESVRIARAELAAGVSPELRARDALIAKLRDEASQKDVAIAVLMRRRDALIRNCCRYLSMRDGRSPLTVLPIVYTWVTDSTMRTDGGPVPSVNYWRSQMQLQAGGWTDRVLHLIHRDMKRYPSVFSGTVTLDDAIKSPKEDALVHKGYRNEWYPPVDWNLKVAAS